MLKWNAYWSNAFGGSFWPPHFFFLKHQKQTQSEETVKEKQQKGIPKLDQNSFEIKKKKKWEFGDERDPPISIFSVFVFFFFFLFVIRRVCCISFVLFVASGEGCFVPFPHSSEFFFFSYFIGTTL